MLIADLQLTVKPTTALYTNTVPDASFTASETSNAGRKQVVLDFGDQPGLYSRDIGTIFTWPVNSGTILYVWQPSLIPQPETIFGRTTDWLGTETTGAKFIQGCMVTANSFNNAKTFYLQSGDDLSIHPLLETPAVFNQQSEKAFSCVPFVAHSARVVSADGVAWQLFDVKLVFQQYPELTKNWTIPMTSFGLTGYGHLREMNIPIISSDVVTLTLSFDQWPPIVIPLASTGGVFRKIKQTITANKFKLAQISLTSPTAFRVFGPEVEAKIGQWDRQSNYAVIKPIGGPNSVGAVV